MLKNMLKRLRSIVGGSSAPRPWEKLIRGADRSWDTAKSASRSGPKVLLATSLGGYENGTLLESTLAVALTLRGAQVHVLLCDRALPACQLSKISKVPPGEFARSGPVSFCDSCVDAGRSMFDPLGLPVFGYSELVGDSEAASAQEIARFLPEEAIPSFLFEGLAIGEHAQAGALRYFARGDLVGEPEAEAVLRRYLEAALRTVHAARALIRKHRYEVACFHHGIYVPQGLIGEVCRQEGVRVVNSNPAYRKQTFVFSHGDTYHHTMISEPVSVWEDLPWTPEREQRTMEYLRSRWYGTEDWIWFHEDPESEIGKIETELGVDFSKPCIGMLTSVMWDAQLHYRSNAFPNMLEWVLKTIDYFSRRQDLQLLIRIHPAEVRGMIPSRQQLADEIRKAFPSLPSNVFVIPPESKISTYAVMEKCGAAIIYNTKTGIELSSMGIPVIVAGEAWIRNKGFSLDANSPEDYYQILDGLPLAEKLAPDRLLRARKYAYHFFFRRMIPFPFISSREKFQFDLDLGDLRDLEPGRNAGLDDICNGILAGAPFVHQPA